MALKTKVGSEEQDKINTLLNYNDDYIKIFV